MYTVGCSPRVLIKFQQQILFCFFILQPYIHCCDLYDNNDVEFLAHRKDILAWR